jgi:sulfotransferase
MKEIFFLNGLPRAGNTVFGSIMNQNPNVAATANSICADMMGELFMLKHTDIFKNYPDHKSFDNVAKTVFENYYKDWKQDYIIDRAPWGRPINLKFLKETRSNIKIIVLVRDIIEVLGSFIDWSNREPTSFVNQYEAKTVEEKCDMLMNKEGQIVKELIGIKHLIDQQPKEMYHIIEFNDLVKDTENIIDGVYNFLGIPKFKHDFNNIGQFKVNDMGYDDAVVGNGLHTLETGAISDYKEKYNAYSIIPSVIINKYKQCNFWEEI